MNHGLLLSAPAPQAPVAISPVDNPAHPMWGGNTVLDREFDLAEQIAVTADPLGWSWINKGGSDKFEHIPGGRARMTCATSGNVPRFIGHAFPGGVWTLTTKFSFAMQVATSASIGIGLTDGTKLVYYGQHRTSGQIESIERFQWTSFAVYNAQSSLQSPHMFGAQYWRMVYRANTSIDLLASADGRTWVPIFLGRDESAVLSGFTPTQVGIATSANGTCTQFVTLDWWRIRMGDNVPTLIG